MQTNKKKKAKLYYRGPIRIMGGRSRAVVLENITNHPRLTDMLPSRRYLATIAVFEIEESAHEPA